LPRHQKCSVSTRPRSLTGTITTDGTIGALSGDNVLAFNLTVAQQGYSPYSFNYSTAGAYVTGSALIATPTALLFDFQSQQNSQFSFGFGTPQLGVRLLSSNTITGNLNGVIDVEAGGGVKCGELPCIYLDSSGSIPDANLSSLVVAPLPPSLVNFAGMLLALAGIGLIAKKRRVDLA
jgi:hypothetical protein